MPGNLERRLKITGDATFKEFYCGECDYAEWHSVGDKYESVECRECGRKLLVNAEDTIYSKTRSVPVIGEIVSDKKLGNKVVFYESKTKK